MASSFTRRFVQSEFGRLFWIGLIVLLLQVPLVMISGVVNERIATRGVATV